MLNFRLSKYINAYSFALTTYVHKVCGYPNSQSNINVIVVDMSSCTIVMHMCNSNSPMYFIPTAMKLKMNSTASCRFVTCSLLLLSLLHITTCTVYTVTPDDHYYPNTTCHHCHNLQHYLLNITKYFTSNTHLLFLPGLHHLHSNLIIQNVHNISLIGSKYIVNGIHQHAIIYFTFKSSSISMINVSRLTIKNIMINMSAQHPNNPSEWIPLTLRDCSFVVLNHLPVFRPDKWKLYNFALVGINVMGKSYFNNVECFDKMLLFYNETLTDKEHHILLISKCVVSSIKFNMIQHSYRVTVKLTDTQMRYIKHTPQDGNTDSLIYVEELGGNKIIISNCQFIQNFYTDSLLIFVSSSNGSVEFLKCRFVDNFNFYTIIYTAMHYYMQVGPHRCVKPALIKLYMNVRLKFENCYFNAKSVDEAQLLQTHGGSSTYPATVIIKNTTFSYIYFQAETLYQNENLFHANTLDLSLIYLSNYTLILEDSVVFSNIKTLNSIISLKDNSTIIISGSVEFSHNVGQSLINFYDNNIEYIIMKENSVINTTYNEVWLLFATKLILIVYPFPYCLFQYFSNTNMVPVSVEKRRFMITFSNNKCKNPGCYVFMPLTHCLWLQQSLFSNMIPLEVNSKYIQVINSSVAYNLSQIMVQSSLCVCTNVTYPDCHINDLGYLYPGQTLTISLHHFEVDTTNAVVVKTDINQQYVTPCTALETSETSQLLDKDCTKLHYTIGFPSKSKCELFLKIASDSDEYLNIFYIRQITCPTGFVKIDKRCQCDPVLVQYGITNCNINDQTILRPANSWVSATTQNDSYIYDISLHCPFHDCLPHSSHLNFSTPNSQCRFNRSGLLCGHCQQGLSTVFSSSHCQNCSTIYILLIMPIAAAGIILVLLLFFLNLTVTDGTINGFILYVNIIGINTSALFTEPNHFSPTYTFISLANLDLGIQTCFYNGMDDYAKMWLQLAFPFYLIFIATLIIITSRYSTTIQRLTARRALPVLATLFLLSYAKILRIVSSVLFFYSTITHLPSKHTTLVWSVDANVPLFGVRFTILFIVCLILFLILVPFNVILLFTRTLSRFRFITKFKPLLDAYQGPYKDKFYYWIGIQLLIRVVVFWISSWDRNINFTVSIILFGIIGVTQATLHPFKRNSKNYHELISIMNLQALFATSLYSQDGNNIVIVNIMITMAVVHFIFIITYHIITYVCGGVIRNKIQSSVNTFTKWTNKFPEHEKFQLQHDVRDRIPEVAFNYHEYREPLLGQDC